MNKSSVKMLLEKHNSVRSGGVCFITRSKFDKSRAIYKFIRYNDGHYYVFVTSVLDTESIIHTNFYFWLASGVRLFEDTWTRISAKDAAATITKLYNDKDFERIRY